MDGTVVPRSDTYILSCTKTHDMYLLSILRESSGGEVVRHEDLKSSGVLRGNFHTPFPLKRSFKVVW